MRVWVPGPQVEVLVDVARPGAGVLEAQVHADDIPHTGERLMAMCALCEADLGYRPRQHGRPAYAAAVAAIEEGPWPRARDWQVADLDTDFFATALQRRIDAYDEELTGEPGFRYGGSGEYDPPGQGAPERGQGVDHAPSGPVPGVGGQRVDHPPTVEEAVQAVLAARTAKAAALEVLGVALRAEYVPGGGRDLSRRAAPAMSRPLVLRALAGVLQEQAE